MIGLYISLAILGLAAVDPVGIGIMPVLLLQKQPYKRAGIFLTGSFITLEVMGLLFAKGLGKRVLGFEHSHDWFVPAVELAGGLILLGIAGYTCFRIKAAKPNTTVPAHAQRWLQLDGWHVGLLGGLLVTVQSVLDVVFVVAMVRTGQYSLSNLGLFAAVSTYAVTALLIQLLIVLAFWLAPAEQKRRTLHAVQTIITNYSNQVLMAVSFGLGCLLCIAAARS